MSRRASAERSPQPREAEAGEKPRLEVIEGGKGKETREPSWRTRAGAELKMMDTLAKEVKSLEKEILAAETAEARAGLVEALEEIEGKLRDARSDWKQIVADVPFPEPSTDVEKSLGEIKKMEESEVARSLREIREMEQPKKPQEAQEPLMWTEPRAGWEKDAKAAANELKDSEPPGRNLTALEILEKNELPPRAEKEIEREARRLNSEANWAAREVETLEAKLAERGIDPEELAVSAVARFKLGFRMLADSKLRKLVKRYMLVQGHIDRTRAEAQIAELAPRDPMRSITANAELLREYANRRKSRQQRDAAYERLVQRGSRLG